MLAILGALFPLAFAQDAATRVLLPKAQRVLSGGSDAGDAPASQAVPAITLELKRTDAQQADLEAFLKASQTRGSVSFHKWLTPLEFAGRFAPGDAAVGKVRSWLESQGLTVQSVSAGGMRLTVSGTAEQADSTFQVRLHRYAQASGDVIVVKGTPSVPSALASSIRAVSGLDSTASAYDAVTTLAASVDSNAAAVVLADLKGAADAPVALVSVLEQASAQGQTVLLLHADAAMLPARALALTMTGKADATIADGSTETTLRPGWQVATGLPDNTLRVAPDAAVATDTAALQTALQTIVAKAGTRQGEVAETFYELAPVKGVFTHADSTVPAGTWTSTDGLGTVNVDALVRAWPYGVTSPDSTTIALSAHTITHGSSITLTATVTGSSGTPTGSITFASAQGGTLTTVPLTSGTAIYSTNALPGGLYGFYGTYSGDTTYAGTTSNVDTATVNPEAVTVVGSVPAAATGVGANIPVTVTVSSPSGVGTPAGVVTVYPYGTDIAKSTYTGTLAASATGASTASVSVPASNAGSFTFQVNCTTDASFSCFSPSSFAVTIAKGTPAMKLTETGTATAATLTAVVTAPAGSATGVDAPTGTVQFLDGTTTLGSGTLDSTGTATYTGALSTAATHTVTAQFQGDGNYNTATAVANASTTTTPTVTLSKTSSGTLQAVVTPASSAGASPAAATGTVQFFNGTTSLGSGTLSAGGVALFTGTLPASYIATAVYGGDTNYNTATSNSLGSGTTVPTVVLISAATSTATAASLSVTVAAPSGTSTVPTGTIQFLDGTTVLAMQALDSTGSASYSGALTSATSHALTASYGGDTVFATATSNTVTIMNALIATTTSLSLPSGTSLAAGTPITFVSVVTPASLVAAGTAPSGTVTIMDATLGAVGTGALVNGTASVTVSVLTTGAHTLTAVYTGDANYAASTSTPPLKLTTTKGPTTTTLAPITLPKAGVPVAVSATVKNAGGGTGAYTYSGTVSFYSNNRVIGKAAVATSGIASGTVVFTSSASQSVTAIYSGDTNWTGSTSDAITVAPSALPAAIVLSSNYASGLVGQNITLTSAVTTGDAASALVPSGTVTFYDTYKGVLVNLGSATLGSNGVSTAFAQISTTGLQTGMHSISAVYTGDTVFEKTSSSAALTVDMKDYALTFAPASLSVTAGSSASTTVTVAAVNGFTGTVALACTAPGDTLTTCAVSPSSVQAGGTAQVTVMTTATTSMSPREPLSSRSTAMLSLAGIGGLACLCCFRRRIRIASLLGLLLAVAMMSGGCGQGGSDSSAASGGSSNTGTPLGTLSFTVTAASVDATVNTRHNFPLSVTVQ